MMDAAAIDGDVAQAAEALGKCATPARPPRASVRAVVKGAAWNVVWQRNDHAVRDSLSILRQGAIVSCCGLGLQHVMHYVGHLLVF
jgi:hypothetical protein